MIGIAITVEAFEAIARTLPVGSVGYEAGANEARRPPDLARARDGGSARRDAGPKESYGDVILRIAGGEALATRRG
jgi:hypothetical protein